MEMFFNSETANSIIKNREVKHDLMLCNGNEVKSAIDHMSVK